MWIYSTLNTLYWKFFRRSEFLSNYRLPLKTEFALKFFTVWNIFLTIQDFWQLCACSEKHSVPWIHCIEYMLFIIQDFWATCACSEKQSCPEIYQCIGIFFVIQEFWATYACRENRVCPCCNRKSPSGIRAKLRTVAASNNRVHAPRSLYYCLFAPRIYIVALRAHPVGGESHIQRNATEEVATPWNFLSRGGLPPPCLVRLC